MNERQPPHKRHVIPITISLMGCLSILLISPVYAQVTNPTNENTISKYCSSGTCSTGPIINFNYSAIQSSNSLKFPNLIGIQLSQACITMLKNHINSTCLTYNDLKQFDNTNPVWSGQWVDSPYYHRLNPKVKNQFSFNLNNQPNTVMVDPDSSFMAYAKMITVENGNFTWINPNDQSIGGLTTLTHVDRYLLGCDNAIVAPNLSLIQDTIKYLESSCTTTSFNDTKLNTHTEIPFSYNNPYSTLHLSNYLSSFLHGHSYFNATETTAGLGPSDCIHKQCSYTDPYKKVGY